MNEIAVHDHNWGGGQTTGASVTPPDPRRQDSLPARMSGMRARRACLFCGKGCESNTERSCPVCHGCRRLHPKFGPPKPPKPRRKKVVVCADCGQERQSWNSAVFCDPCVQRRRGGPCSVCGVLMPLGRTSLPAGERMCQPCRRRRPTYYQAPPASVPCIGCGVRVDRPAGWRSDQMRCRACAVEARRDVNRRKNTRRRGVAPGNIGVKQLGERDGWRCHLCRRHVDSSLSGLDPMGPTIDHLLAISQGGADRWENVALAHRICNVKRGVDRLPAQLLLLGEVLDGYAKGDGE